MNVDILHKKWCIEIHKLSHNSSGKNVNEDYFEYSTNFISSKLSDLLVTAKA